MELAISLAITAFIFSVSIRLTVAVMDVLRRNDALIDLINQGTFYAEAVSYGFRNVLEYGGSLTAVTQNSVAAANGSDSIELHFDGAQKISLITKGVTEATLTFPGDPWTCTGFSVKGLVGSSWRSASELAGAKPRVVMVEFTLSGGIPGVSRTFKTAFKTQ